MLKKSKISGIKIYSDEWAHSRLAKFTASEIHYLMTGTGLGEGALSYIRRKVGEELTGKSAKADIDTDATRWGHFHEAEAITKFGRMMGLEWVITQQLVTEADSRFGCTPDGIIVKNISPDESEYDVETLEIKCPPTFDNYIQLFECETPEDLKKVKKEYYWQVLDQMDNCGCMVGHFAVYHPDFRAGNLRRIRFDARAGLQTDKGKVFPVFNDLKLLRERKALAEAKFDEIRDRLLAVPRV